jgi:hypothetical protein
MRNSSIFQRVLWISRRRSSSVQTKQVSNQKRDLNLWAATNNIITARNDQTS